MVQDGPRFIYFSAEQSGSENMCLVLYATWDREYSGQPATGNTKCTTYTRAAVAEAWHGTGKGPLQELS